MLTRWTRIWEVGQRKPSAQTPTVCASVRVAAHRGPLTVRGWCGDKERSHSHKMLGGMCLGQVVRQILVAGGPRNTQLTLSHPIPHQMVPHVHRFGMPLGDRVVGNSLRGLIINEQQIGFLGVAQILQGVDEGRYLLRIEVCCAIFRLSGCCYNNIQDGRRTVERSVQSLRLCAVTQEEHTSPP